MQSTTMSANETAEQAAMSSCKTGYFGLWLPVPPIRCFCWLLEVTIIALSGKCVVSELNFIAGFYFLFWPEYQLKSGYSVGCSLLFWFQQNVSLIFWYDVHITRLCCVRSCHRLLSARLEADSIWATKEYVMYSRLLFQLSTIGNVQGKKKTSYGINFPYRNWKDNLTHGLYL